MTKDLEQLFIQTVQSNQGIINSVCRVYFPRLEDQKDARQEIILQLWKAFPNFRGASKVSTWIYKVALNTILNQLRKKDINWETADANNIKNLPNSPNTDDDIQQLQQIISLLKYEDKALVILHLEGYSHKEISETLNTSPTNISTRLNRIKERLKTLYKKYNHELK